MALFGKPNIEKMQRQQDFKGLCKALGHKDKELQSQAINALVEMGEAAVEPLIAALAKNELHTPATNVLTKIGEMAVEPLIGALNNMDAKSLNRRPIIRILSKIRDKRAVEPLIEVLNDTNTDYRVCGDVAIALGEIGDQRVIEPLIATLSRDTYTHISASVAKALCKFSDTRIIEPLIGFLQKSSRILATSTIIMVIKALIKFDDKRVVELTRCAMKDSQTKDPMFLPEIAETLGRFGDARAIEPLIELLQNSDQLVSSDTRSAMTISSDRILSKGKAWRNVDQKTINNMMISGQRMDRGIRLSTKISTIVALGRIGDTKAVEALNATLADQDPRVQLCTLEALASIRQHNLHAPAMAKQEKTNLAQPIETVGTVRAESGDEPTVEYLIKNLKNPDKTKALEAAHALGKIGDKRALEPLIALAREYGEVHAVLYGFDDPRAQEALESLPLLCAKCDRHLQKPRSFSLAQPRIMVGSPEELAKTPLECTACNLIFCMDCASKTSGKALGCPICGWGLLDMATRTPVDYHGW